jgi:PAS domain S-box-containing protein
MAISNILIIDDDQEIYHLIASILEDSGEFRFFHARDGADGLAQATVVKPDLIFLDLAMPVLDGVSFLKSLQQQSKLPCPIVVITGHENVDMLHECYVLGVVALVRKPFEIWEISALAHRYTKYSENRDTLGSDLQQLLSDGSVSQALKGGLWQEDLLEAITLPMFVKNKDRNFVFINKAFTDVSNLTTDDVIGRKASDIKRLNVSPEVAKQERRLLRCGGVYSSEEILQDASGKQKGFVCHYSAITVDDGGQVTGIVGVFVEEGALAFSEFKKQLTLLYPTLSPRECDVASLVRLGLATKEVASHLGVSLSTVEFHRNNLREKLGIKGDKRSLVTTLLAL